MLPGSQTGSTAAKDKDSPKATITRQALFTGDETPAAVRAPALTRSTTPTIRKRPSFYGSSSRIINGSGLSGNSTNSTSVLVQYLTQTRDYSNQTVKNDEVEFWNRVGSEIRKKVDGGNTVTRDFALAAVNHSGTYNVQQVCDLWDAVVPPVWTYVNDPADPDVSFWDYFAAASESITVGLKGDCDDFAILNAALVEAIGGNSRVIYAANPGGAHMYAEAQFDSGVDVTQIIRSRYALQPSAVVYTHPGNWLNLDWSAPHPGGTFYDDGGTIWIVYKDGHWEKLRKEGATWNIILSGP